MKQSDEEVISAYVASKGTLSTSAGVDAIFDVLFDEYGRIAPAIRGMKTASVVSAPLDEIVYHRYHLERIEAREPVGAGVPVIGILIDYDEDGKKYRLIDGHHRMKWCLIHGEPEEAVFILLR